jgi:hypothetical protein
MSTTEQLEHFNNYAPTFETKSFDITPSPWLGSLTLTGVPEREQPVSPGESSAIQQNNNPSTYVLSLANRTNNRPQSSNMQKNDSGQNKSKKRWNPGI